MGTPRSPIIQHVADQGSKLAQTTKRSSTSKRNHRVVAGFNVQASRDCEMSASTPHPQPPTPNPPTPSPQHRQIWQVIVNFALGYVALVTPLQVGMLEIQWLRNIDGCEIEKSRHELKSWLKPQRLQLQGNRQKPGVLIGGAGFVPPWQCLSPFWLGSFVKLVGLRWDMLFVITWCVDLVFIIDMVLQFITMYPKTTARGLEWEFRPRNRSKWCLPCFSPA